MSNAHNDLERHMLVWLTAAGWHAAIAAARDEHKTALAMWESQDWPVVVRRLDADAASDEICLGLPLPPHAETGEKVRISLRARWADVGKVTPALDLHAVASSREDLAVMSDIGFRVYGSLAMQALTGLQYVSPSSDVDVLFHPTSRRRLEDGVALLARHAMHLPLDGEIVFPGGAAVSWKEWRMAIANPAKVLVKELRSVRLADTASLLATLEAQ